MDMGLDSYGLQARLRPALLALFPAFLSAAVWFPSLYETAAGLVGLAVACGLTVILGVITRSRGLKIQGQLVEEWGGMPTTLSLRHSSNILDKVTTQRYHKFLEENVPHWKAPTIEDEQHDLAGCDEQYDSAVRWLREFSRDSKKFPLVLKENVAYGFMRNSYGIKYVGMTISLISVGVSIFMLSRFPLDGLVNDSLPNTLVVLISMLLTLWWIFGVSKKSVANAAKGYARAVLASCDQNNVA